MHMPIGFAKIRAIALAAAAMWLGSAGFAWAGDGADAGTIQTFLNSVCGALGISSCPQLPTVSQGVIEVAALVYARPEAIRRSQNIAPGSIFAGNPPPLAVNPPVPVVLPVSPSDFAKLALTPLAFVSAEAGEGDLTDNSAFATPAQLYDPNANIFFSAVTTFGSPAGTGQPPNLFQPQFLNLFYDDLGRTNQSFRNGQTVALFSLPLVVLSSNGAERPVMTELTITSCANGRASCFIATAAGDFLGNGTQQTQNAADIGVSFALVFGASPVSTRAHAIFEIQVPLVVTNATDPVYFSLASPQVGIIGTVTFSVDDVGFTPTKTGILPSGASIGIAPYPAPTTTAPIPPGPATSTFGFCASLPDNSNRPNGRLHPAVATFLGVATDGEVLGSTPLGASSMPTLQCPF